MSNLNPIAKWNSMINQVDINEPILGGPNGNANLAPKQLAENVLFLRNRQIVGETIADFGAKADGQTDDLAAINAAIGLNTHLSPVDLKGRAYYVSQAPTNKFGKRLINGQVVMTSPLGGQIQINSYADEGRLLIGKEYAYRLFKRFEVGGTLNGFIYGDSTVATSENGGGYAGVEFEPQNLLTDYLQKVKGVRNPINIVNRAIGGTSVYQMNALPDIDTQNGSTDVIIIKYFINDRGRGLEQATSDLYQKLHEIRTSSGYASVDNLTIILMMQNAVYDPQHGRTNVWDEQVRPIFVKMAREFKCVLFDTYAFLRDVDWASGVIMDDPFGNKQGVHPLSIMQNWIWAGLVDNLISPSDTLKLFNDDFIALTPQSEWVNNEDGFAPIGASRSLDGWVSLRGVLKSGINSQDTIIATLPEGYRPLSAEHFACASSQGLAVIRINPNGNIYLAVAANYNNLSLSGIRFRVI